MCDAFCYFLKAAVDFVIHKYIITNKLANTTLRELVGTIHE